MLELPENFIQGIKKSLRPNKDEANILFLLTVAKRCRTMYLFPNQAEETSPDQRLLSLTFLPEVLASG